ncbi:MAG: hybrid sensor histidine kinase/response regulator [Deltaproteobacteria bacterium]|nr:hybrid sensor histidine kinase/response regulator [Deltaproteobacteria bacterium]
MSLSQAAIMVVDDNPANLKLMEKMLQSQGYSVVTFTRGSVALEAASNSPPDLILLDAEMPEMNGFDVCRQLKADPALREIPVIFISAMIETSDKVKAFSMGCADYVTKPIHFEEVHARVKSHLELNRKRRELHEAYDKLRDLESLRDNLVHMIVHDMRSPLTVVIGNLEMSMSELLPPDAALYMSEALNSANALMAMVSSLLDVSRLEAGQMKLEFSKVDLKILAGEIIRMVQPIIGQRKLTLTSPVEMDDIQCDENLIRRVLQNLISNAIKFTDNESGAIKIGINNTVEGGLLVSVNDNGPGIPLEYRGKVFDKFFQLGMRKQDGDSSTGLGLTFCRLAIEAHGGIIGLASEVGKGSSFWFELPRIWRDIVSEVEVEAEAEAEEDV